MAPKKSRSEYYAFEQHGFIQQKEIDTAKGKQAYGTCPFCGKVGHFFVNKETKNWDCKSCGKEGGFQTFLRSIAEHCKKNFTGEIAISFSKLRGLKLSTLRKYSIGYNPVTRKFIIPIWNSSKDKLWDLRIYDGKNTISTADCSIGLAGWDQFSDNPSTVWLCEGEGDWLAVMEMIDSLRLKNQIAVGLPGAGTFKAEWKELFRNKEVIAVYDNDKAGFEGAAKCYNLLKGVAASTKFVHWPDDLAKGWDVRDTYIKKFKKNSERTLGFLKVCLTNKPKNLEETAGAKVVEKTQVEELTGDGLTAEQVYAGYKKWLCIADTDVIDIMFGTIIANRMPGDPLWLFMVAPSGGTKSVYMMSLDESPRIFTTTTLTPQVLISGANFAGGNDPSLIPKLNNKCLIIKDFTTLLSSNAMVREEILGILRDAYDGKIEKQFGNGVYRSYKSKFGIIAGVTPAIELYTEEHVALGERFLRYRVPMPKSVKDEQEVILAAISNTTQEGDMMHDLQIIAKDTLNHDFKIKPEISKQYIDRIVNLAQWTSLMRSTINRDRFTKEVTHTPFSELGTRLAKQYVKLLMGLCMFRRTDRVTESEFKIIKRVATSTVPSRMEEIIRKMYMRDSSASFSTSSLAKMINLPPGTTDRVAENLSMLNILKKNPLSKTKKEFIFNDDILEMMSKCELYTEEM